MKRKCYTEPQIVFALQQAEAGTVVGKICRKMGIAEATLPRYTLPRLRAGTLTCRSLRIVTSTSRSAPVSGPPPGVR